MPTESEFPTENRSLKQPYTMNGLHSTAPNKKWRPPMGASTLEPIQNRTYRTDEVPLDTDSSRLAAYGPVQRVMDLGLVLTSQGIEVSVVPTAQRGVAELRVSAADEEAALHHLREYHRENRHRRWQRAVPGTNAVFDAQCVTWALLLVICYYFQTHSTVPFSARGVFDSPLVRGGDWWRSVTAVFLHADLGHLISNLTTGLVFLGIAMAEFGAGTALFATTVAGAAANATALVFRTMPYQGLGASGMVMAALGLVAVRTFRVRDWMQSPQITVARGLMAAVFLFILHGFNPASDVLVHSLGFAYGMLLGVLLGPVAESPARQGRWDGIGKTLFLGVFAVSWYLALRG